MTVGALTHDLLGRPFHLDDTLMASENSDYTMVECSGGGLIRRLKTGEMGRRDTREGCYALGQMILTVNTLLLLELKFSERRGHPYRLSFTLLVNPFLGKWELSIGAAYLLTEQDAKRLTRTYRPVDRSTETGVYGHRFIHVKFNTCQGCSLQKEPLFEEPIFF